MKLCIIIFAYPDFFEVPNTELLFGFIGRVYPDKGKDSVQQYFSIQL